MRRKGTRASKAVCVFEKGGELLWAHRDNTAGDNLPPSAVLAMMQEYRKRA